MGPLWHISKGTVRYTLQNKGDFTNKRFKTCPEWEYRQRKTLSLLVCTFFYVQIVISLLYFIVFFSSSVFRQLSIVLFFEFMLSFHLTVTSEDVCRSIRNVKKNVYFFLTMRLSVMFITAVCVLFLVNKFNLYPGAYLALSDVFDYTKAHETVMVWVKAVCSFLFNI